MKLIYLPNDIIFEIFKYNTIIININYIISNKNLYNNYKNYLIRKKAFT